MSPEAKKTRSMGTVVRALGVGLVLLVVFTHARVPHATLPFWETDPTISPVAVAPEKAIPILDVLTSSLEALGPTGTVALNLLALVGVGLVLGAEAAVGRRLNRPVIGLAALGSLPALIHAARGGVADATLASTWLAGVWGAVAIWHAGREARWRQVILGMLFAFIAVLAAKGAFQVFVDHAQTLADFKRDKQAILASHGWTEGSAPALLYERRLVQPEATGWFGLSNVFATFAAAGLVVGAVALAGWRSLSRVQRGAIVSGTVLAGTALALTGSKGGFGSALVGGGAAMAWMMLAHRTMLNDRARRRIGGLIAIGAVVAPLVLVIGRGMVGERLSELSLLFRWFYAEAATRVVIESPVLGVGPAGFQQAYAFTKNPLSPEEVTSPHSVGFDWLGTLGLMGGAWLALLGLGAWRAGRAAVMPEGASPETEPLLTKPRAYVVLTCAVGSAILGLLVASGASLTISIGASLSESDPLPMTSLLAGLGAELVIAAAWILLSIGIGPVLARRPLVAAGALVVLFAHAQIEMTPIQPGSAMLWCALAAACVPPPVVRTAKKTDRLIAASPVVVCLVLAWVALVPIARWETLLMRGARAMEPCGRLAADARRAQDGSLSPARRAELLAPITLELAVLLSEPPAASNAELQGQLARLAASRSAVAYEDLVKASAAFGRVDPPTQALLVERAIATARLVASDPSAAADADRAWIDRAIEAARDYAKARPRASQAWLAVGDSLAALRGTTSEEGREAWERASARSPWATTPVERLLDAALSEGNLTQAAEHARRLLEIDRMRRLDPLRQFSDVRRRELEAIAGTPGPGGS